MKTKLEMAHDYLRDIVSNWEYDDSFNPVDEAWKLADAMQAEAEKRSVYGANWNKEPRETHRNLAEFKMYPDYDASISYPPDALVMYKGEKRLAVSIDIKKEWQPDWSQAPEWANWWVATANQSGKITGGWFYENEPEFGLSDGPSTYHSVGCMVVLTDSFGYKGDWRDSLRKRPN